MIYNTENMHIESAKSLIEDSFKLLEEYCKPPYILKEGFIYIFPAFFSNFVTVSFNSCISFTKSPINPI